MMSHLVKVQWKSCRCQCSKVPIIYGIFKLHIWTQLAEFSLLVEVKAICYASKNRAGSSYGCHISVGHLWVKLSHRINQLISSHVPSVHSIWPCLHSSVGCIRPACRVRWSSSLDKLYQYGVFHPFGVYTTSFWLCVQCFFLSRFFFSPWIQSGKNKIFSYLN